MPSTTTVAESMYRPCLELLCKYQSLPCIAPPELEYIAEPDEPEISKPSNVGAKYDERIARPESWGPCPVSPESRIIKSRNVVE